jgi:hypothetical protein
MHRERCLIFRLQVHVALGTRYCIGHCYVQQSALMQQQHQIYTCPVAVSKLQAEQGVHAGL